MTPDLATAAKLDSYPYRHRLSDVMAQPPVTAEANVPLASACAIMTETGASSVLVLDADGILAGIVTETDVVTRLGRQGAAALSLPLSEIMAIPYSLEGDRFLYMALARMERFAIRHLAVTDTAGRPIGVITPRHLLKMRSRQTVMIGDEVAQARSAADLARSRQSLPSLAAELRQEEVSATIIAGVISGVVRDMTRRGAELVEERLAADGWGPPPAPYALLVLGSAGRGESLLAFDQDNGLVHRGDASADPWFAEFGNRLNALLDEAGIFLCLGDVMVRNPVWRRSLDSWREEIKSWIFEPKMETVLKVDIFFDMAFVHGDRALAATLREETLRMAGNSAFFQQLMEQNIARIGSPLTWFGGLSTSQGRVDAKKYGLLPLVSAARARAIGAGVTSVSTQDRFRDLAAIGRMHRDDLASLIEAHETILGAILDQQLSDIKGHYPPGTGVAPAALPRPRRERLKKAFQRIKLLSAMQSTVMSV
jgi:signal-transduction protein with cAMP-binding, CBS, and nucleotidyltransferase domain